MDMCKRLLVTVIALFSVQTFAAEKMELDASHTYPHFKISHLGFSTMHGRFDTTEGTMVLDREGTGSKVEVVIQAASINTGHAKRDEHLRNEDFFNVDKYPTIEYSSSKVTFTGEDTAIVEGSLTMMGITKPVRLNVDQINCGTHPMTLAFTCGFNATTTLNRSEFGIKKYLPMLGDEIAIEIEAEARVPTDNKPGPK